MRCMTSISRSEAGEFMVLVGPSGCGKSTLLRMIAGLEEITSGSLWIGDREVTNLSPRDRDVAMVFQNYALYPHMTVARNLGYGLRVRKMPKAVIDERVNKVAKLLGLEDLLERRPGALSGGQRQRVAMGRAIVREPAAFLMDEPLSNLDAKLRVGMRAELTRLHKRLDVTTVYVTHDQVEAMTLGQRVAVMRDGFLQQVDTPQDLYHHPKNVFVAAFIGSPSMNLVEATIENGRASFGGFEIPLRGEEPAAGTRHPRHPTAGLRGAAFADPSLADDRGRGNGRRGAGLGIARDLPDRRPRGRRRPAACGCRGTRSRPCSSPTTGRSLFTATVNPASKVRPGSRLTLAVDSSRFHFFDVDSGESLTDRQLATV